MPTATPSTKNPAKRKNHGRCAVLTESNHDSQKFGSNARTRDSNHRSCFTGNNHLMSQFPIDKTRAPYATNSQRRAYF